MMAENQEGSDSIRNLQLAELEVLDEVIAICEACGFRYYMLGGTLLGAVRHGGFIPWDDDVDIALPRADYERFKEVAKVHLKAPFELFCYEDDSECGYAWARVVNPAVSEVIRLANKDRVEQAWVDLIPLDGMPSEKLKQHGHKLRLSFWWNLNQIVQFDELVDQHRKRSALGSAAVKMASCFKFIGRFVDRRVCLERLNDVLRVYDYDDPRNQIAFNYLAAFGFREAFPKACFDAAGWYDFEGRKVRGPHDYGTVLETIYGADYMTPPPMEERNKHNATVI